MDRNELAERTKRFHINVIKICSLLPKNVAAYEIAKQLIRSAGSVGANYRATKRAKPTADFIYKILKLFWKNQMNLITGLQLSGMRNY